MKIKVCGMKYPDNIEGLAQCHPDLTGLIFYAQSRRFVGDTLTREQLDTCRRGQELVGVFVNESGANVLLRAREYNLNWVQLHGEETPDMCAHLRASGLNVIKAIGVASGADLIGCEKYHGVVDFLLFDTRSEKHGGSGRKFNWEWLMKYDLDTPFLLSGGIGSEDIDALRAFDHEMHYGIDINSRFETEPGRKDIDLVASFINEIRQSDGRQ